MSDISAKMAERLETNHGISSDDVAAVVAEQMQEEKQEQKKEEVLSETSSVAPEKPEKNDGAMGLSAAELDSKNFFLGVLGASQANGEVKITPEDKARFIDCVLTNGRMKTQYSFFGGRLQFTIKNRTYDESRAAMIMATKVTESNYRTPFTLNLRLMLMCMQVDELNGTSYKDADKLGPLLPENQGLEVKDPPWLARAKVFGALPEAVFEAIWMCIYEFETKYWTLARHSRDQDFWLPEQTISG